MCIRDRAKTMEARTQYSQRFVRAGTKATASDIENTLSLWKVFLYKHEHRYVKQEKGQASQDMLTGTTNHLATVHIEQAFKSHKNDNFKELKNI